MSETFSLICRETKQQLWIGQGHGSMTTLYTGMPDVMERLKRFLNAHQGKPLEFVCNDRSGHVYEDGWVEFEDPDDIAPRLPEGGGTTRSTDHSATAEAASPARQSGSPEVDPSGERQTKPAPYCHIHHRAMEPCGSGFTCSRCNYEQGLGYRSDHPADCKCPMHTDEALKP